jgi:hypothetical protein
MPYISINNFKYGLDTRRSELSSVPGSLMTLNNAHINQGGEIEKRKAFVNYPLPAATYGMLATQSTVYVFGSVTNGPWTSTSTDLFLDGGGNKICMLTYATDFAPAIGDTIVVSGSSVSGVNGVHTITGTIGGGTRYFPLTFTSSSTTTENTTSVWSLPTNVAYQQLTNPIAGTTMTGVVTATSLAEQIFVVTTWSNGDTLCFVDQTLLTDFVYGQQGTQESNAYEMAYDLCEQINATGDYVATTPALPTYLSLQVVDGTSNPGTNQATYGYYDFGRTVALPGLTTSTFPLTINPVNWTTSNSATASLIVTEINTNPYGFVASIGTPNNVIKVTPPAVDDNGDPLGVQEPDSLLYYTGGNVKITIFPNVPVFNVSSVPTADSTNPFTISKAVENASLTYQLISNGTKSLAGTSAVGQFSISYGDNNPKATGVLTIVNNPSNANTITIGSTTYTFVTTLTGVPNLVKIDVSKNTTLANLVSAINATAGAGTAYSVGTVINTQVVAGATVAGSTTTTTVTAIVSGVVGNSIPTTSSSANLTWANATLVNGGCAAYAYIGAATNPANTDTVTINGKTYTILSTVGTANGNVHRGANTAETLKNLYMAINLQTPNTGQYGTSMTIHPTVEAYDLDTVNGRLYLRAKTTGATGNAYTLTKTGAVFTVSGATFSGGGVDTNQISQVSIGTTNLFASGTYVAFNENVNQTATDVVTAINGYSGTSNYTAKSVDNIIQLSSVVQSTTVNNLILTVTAQGTVCIAGCNYAITTPQALQNISSIKVDATTELLTATMTYEEAAGFASETLAQYLQRVVSNINNNTATSLFVAAASNTALYLSRKAVASSDAAPGIVATSTMTLNAANAAALTVRLSADNVEFANYGSNSSTKIYSIGYPTSVTAIVGGGVPPYTFSWAMGAATITSTSTQFYIPLPQIVNPIDSQWWRVKTSDIVGADINDGSYTAWPMTVSVNDANPVVHAAVTATCYLIVRPKGAYRV